MLGFALAALAIWVGFRLMGWPASRAWATIGALLAFLIAVHFIQSGGRIDNPGNGSDARLFLLLLLLGLAVAAYRVGLAALRRRARPPAPPAPAARPGAFAPAELDRYARHIILREIGGTGQKRLKSARVLVVGAGGLGSPALLYLAGAGVGTIGVIDGDVVENTNLQRQIIHTDARIGMPKVFSAEAAMRALNPFIEVRPYNRRLDEGIAADLIADYDLILDGSDNFDTRYLVNRAAVAAGKPLIAAAITQWEGQLSLYHPAAGGPCYECLFPTRPAPGLVPTCAEAGVAAPLPGILGAMMASEAVKHLTGAGETLQGRLMIHDALYAETRVIAAGRRPDCPVCGG